MRRHQAFSRRSASALGTVVLLVGFLVGSPAPAWGQATTLFFSEYVEGTSNNKALEIFNCTGVDVDLATEGYKIQMFFNGSAVAGLTIDLTGVIANGGVYVVAQSAAHADILAVADQTSGAGFYNGNDAVALVKNTAIVDVIGQIGFDPGTEWGDGNTSTADNTLRRRSHVAAGDSDGTNSFNPSADWVGFPVDTFDGLGAHSALCGDLIAVIQALQNHTHTYLTGRGAGHNNTEATTGPATFPE